MLLTRTSGSLGGRTVTSQEATASVLVSEMARMVAVPSATLVSVVDIWPEDGSSLDPELKATDIPGPSVEALPALAAKTANEIPALLVYTPASATLGEVLPFVRTLQKTRPNVYFFVEGAK